MYFMGERNAPEREPITLTSRGKKFLAAIGIGLAALGMHSLIDSAEKAPNEAGKESITKLVPGDKVEVAKGNYTASDINIRTTPARLPNQDSSQNIEISSDKLKSVEFKNPITLNVNGVTWFCIHSEDKGWLFFEKNQSTSHNIAIVEDGEQTALSDSLPIQSNEVVLSKVHENSDGIADELAYQGKDGSSHSIGEITSLDIG